MLAAKLAALPGWSEVPPSVSQAIVAGITHTLRTRLPADEGEGEGQRQAKGAPSSTHRQVADRLTRWILSLRGASAFPAAQHPAANPPAGSQWGIGAVLRGEVGDERGRILAAAARLGAREGYAALTVPRIRSHAGVSVAAAWQLIQAELEAGWVAELPRLAPLLAYLLTR